MFDCVTPAGGNIGRGRCAVASGRPDRRSRALPGAALLAIAAALGGCSAAIPLPAFVGSKQDVTGSITPANPISSAMDAEDWRRAKGALGLALDPQGNGEAVSWDNPKSGARGAFTPVGPARPVDDRICRSFVASVGGSLPQKSLQGSACRGKDGEWMIGEIAPPAGAKAG
ncbi:MAG: RT0821/Lpp0805 family surface protein [Beijerinckiaceae bacterium]